MKETVCETAEHDAAREGRAAARQDLAASRRVTARRARVACCGAVVLAVVASSAFMPAELFISRAASKAAFMPVAADEAAARRALESAFQMLRAGDFGGLYDALPAASRRRITRARFVDSLSRARGAYELERMEVAGAHVAGDLAVFDTVIYGRALRPFVADGRIEARQYMVREGGRWRVTTGDRQTVRPLLAAHPDLARRFPPHAPRLYVRRDGQWVELKGVGGRR